LDTNFCGDDFSLGIAGCSPAILVGLETAHYRALSDQALLERQDRVKKGALP
jgi:hypothetical protein